MTYTHYKREGNLTCLSASHGVSGSSGIPQFSTPSIGLAAKAAINRLLCSSMVTVDDDVGAGTLLGNAGFADCVTGAVGVAMVSGFFGCDSVFVFLMFYL